MSREMPSSSSDESIAARAFGIIRRRAAVATVAFATVLAAAVAFALYLPDLYKASALVVIERPLAEAVVGRPAVGADLESRLYVIKSEILSRDRLTQLVKRFNLYPELQKKASFEDVLNQARQDIDYEPTGPEQVSGRTKTVTFTLSYTGNDRKNVADVTNAVAAFYINHNTQMRAEEARQAALFLKARVAEAKQAADNLEAKLLQFTAAHQHQLPQSVSVNAMSYAQIRDDLRSNQAAQDRIIDQREKLLETLDEATAKIEASTPSALPGGEQVPPSKEFNDLNDRLATATKNLIELERQGKTDSYPDVASTKLQIDALRKDVQAQRARDIAAFKAQQAAETERRAAIGAPAEASTALPRSRRNVADLDQELARLKKEEAELRNQSTGLEARFDSVPGVQQEYSLIQGDYRTAKEAYDVAERKYQEAKIAESIEAGNQAENFRILEAAIVPEGPAAPNRLRLLIMGLLLALAAMGAAVVAAEQLDTSFHSVDEVREFTSIPVLATIPQIGAAPRKGYLRLAVGTISAVAAIVLIGSLSAYFANGNETLVRLLQRAG